MADFVLTTGNDNLVGTGGSDNFTTSVNQLSGTDIIDGGGGIDTLIITTPSGALDGTRLIGLSSIERLQFVGGGAYTLVLDDHAVDQATDDRLTVAFGASTLSLNTSAVSANGQVFLEGTGQVTLRNFVNQRVSIVDGVNGNVVGGTLDDLIKGGSGADLFDGGSGDDNLLGGSGNDTISGGNGNDVVDGGLGNDSLSGGLGFDLITLGQTDNASGGAGGDAFVIGADATSVTITDFAVADPLERIDLRAIGSATGFGALTITTVAGSANISIGGKTIILSGIAAASLTADNFVFAGQTDILTAAQLETADVYFGVFTAGADLSTGTSGNDVFQSSGSITNLTSADIINGGGGIDTLRIVSADLSFDTSKMSGYTSVERLDLISSASLAAGGVISLVVDAAAVTQAGGVFTVYGGTNPFSLNLSTVGNAGTVKMATFGLVTLRNFEGQSVTVDDSVNGKVAGGTGADNIFGGLGNDSLSGGTNDDNISGGEGNDTLSGENGNDFLDGGLGNDSLLGGLGYDQIFMGQADTATGGAGSDTFVIGSGATTVTISDLAVTDPLERIDLRAIGAATGFDTLTITTIAGNANISVGGTTVVLSGVTAGQVTADDFVFAGQTDVLTAAQMETADVYFGVFTAGADLSTGTSGNDVFQSSGSITNLTSADIINGGGGIDTLRIVSPDLSFDTSKMSGYTSVERLDLISSASLAAGGVISLVVDAAAVSQAGGVFTIYGGNNPFSLDVSTVGNAGTVKMATFGLVTLRNFEGQSVTVDDSVNGKIAGATGADNIFGGLGKDSLSGGTNDDNISGGEGNDTLAGENGNDFLDGGLGNDSLLGGLGYDLIVMGQADTATGGAGSDTFVIGSDAATVTITDLAVTDPLERIDLRAIGAATGFNTLTITTIAGNANISVGGTTVVLSGVTAGQVTADDFVFAGQTDVVTAAQMETADVYFGVFTPGADLSTGTSGNDVFQSSGSSANLTSADIINGGGGIDTLRIVSPDLSFDTSKMSGYSSIERLDVISSASLAAGGFITLNIDAAAVTQAGGVFTVFGGNNPFALDVSAVGNAGTVKMATFGLINLRDFFNHSVTIDDSVNGLIQGGTGRDTIAGGSGNDSLSGDGNSDMLVGGAGNDLLHGENEDDVVTGGLGNDSVFGDAGRDQLISDAGDDQVTGGANSDTFVIQGGSGTTTITDFSVNNLSERIDLRAFADAADLAALAISDTPNGAQFTVGGHTVILAGVSAAALTANDFIFNGQVDINTFYVPAGASQSDLQMLFDEAPAGAVIQLAAGTFDITETLFVRRSDITIQGAGSTLTTFNSLIDDSNPSATLTIESPDFRVKVGDIAVTGVAGATTLQLTTTAGLSVGSILYLAERNDAAYLALTGNTGLLEAEDYAVNPDRYALREQITQIIAIDGNTVTLAEPLAYTFHSNADNPGNPAWAGLDSPLTNVHISGFQVVTTFPDVDPHDFVNTREAWTSIPTIDFDSVANSSISDVAIHNPASHGFRFQRVYELSGDYLSTEGAQNKGEGGNGYAYYFSEAFATDFEHISDLDMRHSVLFSSSSAEHYNYIQVDSTNRDVNFHGSPDAGNTVIVDHAVADYGNSLLLWPSVGPGQFPLHPYSTIEANTVVFGYLRTNGLDQTVHAVDSGGDIGTAGGNDRVFGGLGADLLSGGDGQDTITGDLGADTISGDADNDAITGGTGADVLNGGAGLDTLDGGADADSLQGGDGQDVLTGGSGLDILNGGDGQDILDGGSGSDLLTGGLGHDLVYLSTGDTGAGGAGFDTFVFTSSGLFTVSDFDIGNTQERLDLRAIAGATSLAALAVSQTVDGAQIVIGGAQILLTGIAASDLTAANFVFAGQSTITMAQSLTAAVTGYLSSNADVLTGGATANTFQGSALQLTAIDSVNGGAGIDTLRLTGASAAFDENGLGALISIERIDVSLITGTINARVIAANAAQATGGVLTLIGGSNDISLDSRTVALGNLIVDTSGVVTLRNFDAQAVTLGDNVRGTAVGGMGADTIVGGALADNLTGGINNDRLNGQAGNDLIDGGLGNDVMTGGTGIDTFQRRFGEGSDTITDFTPGAGGDVIVLNGYATDAFAELVFLTSGADTILRLGQDGQIVLKNVAVGALSADNFTFVNLGLPRAINIGATDDLAVGSDGDDVFTIGGSHVDDGVTIIGGAGNNIVVVPTGNFTGSTAQFGTYSNINALDFSSATSIVLTFDQAILNQAANKALTLEIGAATNSVIDIGTPTGGAKLQIDGGGAVTLSGARNQVVYATDTVGVNITGGAANDQIFGGTQDDKLRGGSGNDKLIGGVGNDSLDGGLGTDTLTGGLGDDSFVIDSLLDQIVEAAGQGSDTVLSSITLTIPVNIESLVLTGIADVNATGSAGSDILVGNAGKNALTGGSSNDSLSGQAGDDVLDGGIGADAMSGGLGNDIFIIDHIGDIVTELADEGLADTVKTNLNGYTLADNVENLILAGSGNINGNGNALNNTLTGNAGKNMLQGGAGDDILGGGIGADTLVGGDGSDTYVVDNVADVVAELLDGGLQDTIKTDLLNYVLIDNVENLTLTGPGNANATGNTSNNILTGNAGNNALVGGKGDDNLQGGSGDDVLNGGTGSDRMNGGLGNDTYWFGVGDRIDEPGDGGAVDGGVDTVMSTVRDYSLASNLEHLTLVGDGAVNGTGNAKNNIITGNGLNNILQGGDGHDTITGLVGVDTLAGGRGNDVMDGGDGNDVLFGGEGADLLTGGAGNDVFMYQKLQESQTAGRDTIMDLSSTDIIDLSRIDANVHVAGNQAFTLVSAFTGHQAELVLTYDAGTNRTFLTADANGDAIADFALIILGNHTAHTGWLL